MGATSRVVISFLDMDYNNTRSIQSLGISDGTSDEKSELAARMAEVARGHDMAVETCAEEIDLEACGIRHGHCIDADLIERIAGKALSPKGIEDPIRPAMGEMASKGFTHVSILEDGRVVGAFSENTFLTHANSVELTEIAEDDTFSKIGDLLPLDNHESGVVGIVERGQVAIYIAELFQNALIRKGRPGMLFVTVNGKQSERMLGVLTSWDMAAFF